MLLDESIREAIDFVISGYSPARADNFDSTLSHEELCSKIYDYQQRHCDINDVRKVMKEKGFTSVSIEGKEIWLVLQ